MAGRLRRSVLRMVTPYIMCEPVKADRTVRLVVSRIRFTTLGKLDELVARPWSCVAHHHVRSC